MVVCVRNSFLCLLFEQLLFSFNVWSSSPFRRTPKLISFPVETPPTFSNLGDHLDEAESLLRENMSNSFKYKQVFNNASFLLAFSKSFVALASSGLPMEMSYESSDGRPKSDSAIIVQ
ncbi:hypothetical protein MA16_Dca003179 [Dendrobium catenatum]|uniref:Uncharacterized protein n=1 Tax=Dendrobium catenatum TaxID=906689 RepID=A0A2I0XC05_9ASPA|nr:hypothetical protein MA16_Dca003179 [Dendrobium catenatum]